MGHPRDKHPLLDMSATQMVEAIRQRTIRVEPLIAAHIEQIRKVNDSINAVIHPLFTEALNAAKQADRRLDEGTASGTLFGVPMTIKDQFLLRQTPTSFGLSEPVVRCAEKEGPLVQRLREEGAIFLGKTNMPQVALTYECRHGEFGPSSNPWNTKRVPGGSSGGEAAIIAAKGSPLGLGGDMGGSIRIPTHNCGINGLKPTNGRFPNDDSPLLPERFGAFSGFEPYTIQPGPMARHVDDLKLMMDTLLSRPLESRTLYAPVPWATGPIADANGLRIGFYTDQTIFPTSTAVKRVVMNAVEILKNLGHTVVSFDFPTFEEAFILALTLISAAGADWVKQVLQKEPPTPTIKNLIGSMSVPDFLRPLMCRILSALGQESSAKLLRYSAPLSADKYQCLTAERSKFRARFLEQMDAQNIDILVCPAYAVPAPFHNDDISGAVTLAGCYSFVFNLIGNPAGVVAAGRVGKDETDGRLPSKDPVFKTAHRIDAASEGMPLGVQVVGRYWREDQVLSVMKTLETAFRLREEYPDLPIS